MKEQHQRIPSEYEFKNLKKREFMILMSRSNQLAKTKVELSDLDQSHRRLCVDKMDLKKEIEKLQVTINKLQIERVADLKAAKYFVEIGNSGGTHNEKRHLVGKSIKMIENKEQNLLKGLAIANAGDDLLPF